jgi:hypothetical protein
LFILKLNKNMENTAIVELVEKNGFFYFNDKQIMNSSYPFTDYAEKKRAFGFLKEGKIYDTFIIIHQCCTGLVVHKRSDGKILITSMPIIPQKAELVNGEIHFSGAACNGEGTVAYITSNYDYKWINRIR